MNPFKPRRTFESVVRELVAGLEDGSVVLRQEVGTSSPQKQTIKNLLFSSSLGMRMNVVPPQPLTNHRLNFVGEWVHVDLGVAKVLPIEFDSSISAPIGH